MSTTGKCLTAAMLLLTAWPTGLVASEHRHFSSRGEVDLEDLDAEIRWDGEKWRLVVEYDVEIEDDAMAESYDLVLNLFNRSRPDQPVQIIVPLVQPSEVEDDELTYEDKVVARVDPSLIGDPGRLRLAGMVVRRGGGEVMDREETSVDHKR